METRIRISDIVILADGRRAIVHEVYDDGRAILVETSRSGSGKTELPIVDVDSVTIESSSIA